MKTGSIILHASKGFLPNQIRLHMKIWGRQTGRDYALPYNHAEVAVMYRGRLMSMGARAGGCQMTPMSEYLAKHTDYAILEPKVTLSITELKHLEAYAEEICYTNPRKYQKANFLAWMNYIRTFGRAPWIRKDDHRLYCYELAGRCAALVGRWDAGLDFVSIYDLWENKHYQEA